MVIFKGRMFGAVALFGAMCFQLVVTLPVAGGVEPLRKAAVFVANRAGEALESKVQMMEDLVTARVSDMGYSLISREVVLDAMRDLDPSVSDSPTELDQLITNNSSALRLAQNLGADYVFVVSLLSYGKDQRTINAYGVKYDQYDYTLRASYKIISGSEGGSLTSDVVKVSKSYQQSPHSMHSSTDLVNDLLDQASVKIAASFERKVATSRIAQVKAEGSRVPFSVNVEIADITVPEMIIQPDGTAKVTANRTAVQAVAVAVEVDGIVIGTTSSGSKAAELLATPGLHHIRLSKDGLKSWERMINIYDGMPLNVTMEMTGPGYDRWKEKTALINQLKSNAVLTAAEAEEMRGMAQALRQSGYKLDIKVDTKEAVTIENNSSLLNNN